MENLLVVGLGNPGEKYRLTRHNIGVRIVDKLAEKFGLTWKRPRTSLFGRANYVMAIPSPSHPQDLFSPLHFPFYIPIKPLTYMNASGEAVKSALHSLGHAVAKPVTLVVVSDEYNFPVGRVDLKRGGSSGGHNGLQSIIDELGTTDFWRLRCGIGREFGPGELVEYVLSPFPDDQLEAVENEVDEAVKKLEEFFTPGIS